LAHQGQYRSQGHGPQKLSWQGQSQLEEVVLVTDADDDHGIVQPASQTSRQHTLRLHRVSRLKTRLIFQCHLCGTQRRHWHYTDDSQ